MTQNGKRHQPRKPQPPQHRGFWHLVSGEAMTGMLASRERILLPGIILCELENVSTWGWLRPKAESLLSFVWSLSCCHWRKETHRRTNWNRRCQAAPSFPSHHSRRPTWGSKNHLIIDFAGALRETLLANILSESLDGIFILYISKLVTIVYLP